MRDLEAALGSLGDELRLDEAGLVDDVIAALDTPASRRPARPWLAAAAVLLAVVTATLVVPSSRRAVADWFGLDGVRIERRPDLSLPAGNPPGVVIDEFDGSLDPELVTKTVGDGTTVRRVEVDGHPGLWIDGSPHELILRDAAGAVVSRRVAGNTLLWQDGTTIRRVEGFDSLDEALAFVDGG